MMQWNAMAMHSKTFWSVHLFWVLKAYDGQKQNNADWSGVKLFPPKSWLHLFSLLDDTPIPTLWEHRSNLLISFKYLSRVQRELSNVKKWDTHRSWWFKYLQRAQKYLEIISNLIADHPKLKKCKLHWKKNDQRQLLLSIKKWYGSIVRSHHMDFKGLITLCDFLVKYWKKSYEHSRLTTVF